MERSWTSILARTSSGGTTAWYLTDKLGSVRDIVSTSGTELDHIVYDSFGNIVTETNAANGDRFKFAGMQYDATIGQYYDHARWYAPSVGRFTGTDPALFSAKDTNLYRYAHNSTTNRTDPSGEDDVNSSGTWVYMGTMNYVVGYQQVAVQMQGLAGSIFMWAPVIRSVDYYVWMKFAPVSSDPMALKINPMTITLNGNNPAPAKPILRILRPYFLIYPGPVYTPRTTPYGSWPYPAPLPQPDPFPVPGIIPSEDPWMGPVSGHSLRRAVAARSPGCSASIVY